MVLAQTGVPGPRSQQVRCGPLGKITAAGQAEIFDVFLCKLSPAQLLQCCLWLYASLPPAAAQGLARRCPQGILPSPKVPQRSFLP